MADRRGRGPRTIAATLEKITKPLFNKRGLADGTIVTQWTAIVGDAMAKFTAPERITYPLRDRRGGTLYLKVANGSFATELVHLEPQLIERINGYFGYKAIDKIHIKQGPIAPAASSQRQAPAAINSHDEPDISNGGLQNVDDPELAEALKALGQAVARRHKRVTKP